MGSLVHPNWSPILTGDRASKARSIIQKTVQEIMALHPPPCHPGVATGYAGLALGFHYLNQCQPENDFKAVSEKFLNLAVDHVARHASSTSLFSGFTGVAWVLAYIQKDMLHEIHDSCTEIDKIIINYIKNKNKPLEYDLIDGLVGLGIYAIERFPKMSGKILLDAVLSELIRRKIHLDGGFTWLTPPELLPEWQKKQAPLGYYNLGLAHGVPGVINLIGRVCFINSYYYEKYYFLLKGAIRWLIMQSNPSTAPSSFSRIIPIGEAPENREIRMKSESRIAWCYGDLGIGLSLLHTSIRMQESRWKTKSLEILRKVAAKNPIDAGMFDASLCHGSAGNAHLFNRIFQTTGDPLFKKAALTYFDWTFDHHSNNSIITSFSPWDPDRKFPLESATMDSSFLTGTMGVALALLSGISEIEPEWDRILMVDSAIRGRPPAGNWREPGDTDGE
ncbi:MAG: lanthionine synthetase C family protein [Holophagaceae bacterium]